MTGARIYTLAADNEFGPAQPLVFGVDDDYAALASWLRDSRDETYEVQIAGWPERTIIRRAAVAAIREGNPRRKP